MAYTANIPKNRRFDRINDKSSREDYPITKEGLSDNKYTIIQFIPSDPVFLSIDDVAEKTGWSIRTVQKLFNAPGFPSTDLGKKKLVLASALTAYFTYADVFNRMNDDAMKKFEDYSSCFLAV